MVEARNARLLAASLALAAGLTLVPRAALAWNDTGHRLTALVAWELLDAPTRAEVARIIRAHERFRTDFKDLMPEAISDADPETRDRWIFLQASVWPDLAATFTEKHRTKHHHPEWHSIHEPIFLTDDAEGALFSAGLPINVGTKWFPSMAPGEMNAIQALQRCRAHLRDRAAPAAEKALMLTWLVHLVGDLHQPMHATALFSRQRFPAGDRGGVNVPTSVRENLHSYWDGLLGAESFVPALEARVHEWFADEQLSEGGQLATKILDPKGWMAEGVALASSVAYSEGVMATLLEAESDAARVLAPFEVDEDYGNAARRVAETRIVEAGYRLATMLKELLQ